MAVFPFDTRPYLSQLFENTDVMDCIKANMNTPCTHTDAELDIYIAQAEEVIAILPILGEGTFKFSTQAMGLILGSFVATLKMQKCMLTENCGILDKRIDRMSLYILDAYNTIKGLGY